MVHGDSASAPIRKQTLKHTVCPCSVQAMAPPFRGAVLAGLTLVWLPLEVTTLAVLKPYRSLVLQPPVGMEDELEDPETLLLGAV